MRFLGGFSAQLRPALSSEGAGRAEHGQGSVPAVPRENRDSLGYCGCLDGTYAN